MNRHARRKVLGRFLPTLRIVCDLGCGTGTTAVDLARSGHRVYAVDASPAQCRQARLKVRRAGVDVRVICADMKRLRLPERVDLVLCEFNPLNHLGRKSALGAAFRAVARALRPGGWFSFDLNMRPTTRVVSGVLGEIARGGPCGSAPSAADTTSWTEPLGGCYGD